MQYVLKMLIVFWPNVFTIFKEIVDNTVLSIGMNGMILGTLFIFYPYELWRFLAMLLVSVASCFPVSFNGLICLFNILYEYIIYLLICFIPHVKCIIRPFPYALHWGPDEYILLVVICLFSAIFWKHWIIGFSCIE